MSWELSWTLAVRDIKAQYRQSFFGVLWVVLLPLANTAMWLFLNATGVVQVSTTDLPYPIYVFVGSMLWSVFAESATAPGQQISANRAVIAKLNFAKEALVLSAALQSAFNAFVKLLLISGVIILFGIHPGWAILLAPLGMLSLILAGLVVGLLLAPIGALYGDVAKALPLMLQFGMYLTPVVYEQPDAGWVTTAVAWNPLTPLISTTRAWLTGVPATDLAVFGLTVVLSMVALLATWLLYRLALPIVAERMSA